MAGPGWRNGRRRRLKPAGPQGRAGSSPAPGTRWWDAFRFVATAKLKNVVNVGPLNCSCVLALDEYVVSKPLRLP